MSGPITVLDIHDTMRRRNAWSELNGGAGQKILTTRSVIGSAQNVCRVQLRVAGKKISGQEIRQTGPLTFENSERAFPVLDSSVDELV